MKKEKTIRSLCGRVNRARGQLEHIDEMLRENRPLEDVLIQFLAVKGAIRAMIYEHFNDLIRPHLAQRLNALLADERLPVKAAERLDFIRKEFPRYRLKQLPKIFYELRLLVRLNGNCC